MKEQDFKAVCFGEVLIDAFPEEEKIGGAPLNVACRLSAFGIEAGIISRIGKDVRGEQILSFLTSRSVYISNIQTDPLLPTGVVTVQLGENGSAIYDIKSPAAWDHIEVLPSTIETVKNSDVFIFGSLSCRNSKTRNTLFQLLNSAAYKVFDVNLRPPFYDKELLEHLIRSADFIKFNEEELKEIVQIFGCGSSSPEENILFISSTFETSTICVTKGSEGAVLFHRGKFIYNLGYPIKVKDTVGAGDSFLAGLIAKLLLKEESQKALDFACGTGALVAASEGANPKITTEEIEDFIFRRITNPPE